jgi:hypothetical protein
MEDPMPHVTVPEDTFRRLSARAAALNISVDDLVKPALDRLAETGTAAPESPLPLTGAAWRAELEAWKRNAESRAARYPPGFVLDDSRETIYREREGGEWGRYHPASTLPSCTVKQSTVPWNPC